MGQRYRRMEDQKPNTGLACNQVFAKMEGFGPKVEVFSKSV